ncbi:hypothetical protein M8C21_022147 [Ambrosia artemisiifolia]|uniref:Protein prune homolog n=1 Tax=Ambrosia artemisiifolia TaxID=4212 RepID=A0AAD5CGB4_AMBAR|nr:hypothetical protein M8C21_022147 [Ambrosia artemisiifolia]
MGRFCIYDSFMGSPSDSMLQNQQGKYIRARENPFFDGLKRGNASMNNRKSLFDFMGRTSKQKVTRSSSAIGHTSDLPQLHIRKEPFDMSLSGSVDLSSPQIADDIQSHRDVQKSFISFSKREQVSLPPCAASFYYGSSPQIDAVESCESIQKLNMYLKASKAAVNVGVPGQFLRVVLGPISDAGSFISIIMYSLYLHETDKTSQFCTVPVINLKRTDINSHGELDWLLSSCNIDLSSILFIDEVDLSYYDLFGSLKIVLLNADMLQEKHVALKDSVVEAFNCQKEGSCCALIAEKFASISPGILTGKGFSRLLLAGILLDTENLTSSRCTCVDRYMSTLLLNGAVRSKMHDVSQFSVGQILQKDFRKWSTIGKTDIDGPRLVVGMSAVGISISQLLSHNETSVQEIILFQQLEKLRLLIIISSYNHHKNFKEMLISAESEDLMKDLLHFLDTHATHLPLHALYHPGLGDEMRAFTIDSVPSRTTMEQLLQDFCNN